MCPCHSHRRSGSSVACRWSSRWPPLAAASPGPSRRRPASRCRRWSSPPRRNPRTPTDVPGSVTAVTADTLSSSGARIVVGCRAALAQHVLHRVHGRKSSNPALPRHRRKPGQPRHHDLLRWRAAAERELVEPRAARRLADRVRPRTAEPALRPQRARRDHQRHQRPPVALRTGPAAWWRRSATPRPARCGASVSGPLGDHVGVGFAIGTQARDGFTVNDVTGNDLDSREGHVRQGAAAVGSVAELGGAGHLQRRAGPRRRLCAGRPRPCAQPARSTCSGTSRAIPIATSRGTTVLLRGEGERVTLHQQHGVRRLGDRGRDRSRLQPAAAGDAHQPRGRLPVHPGGSRRLGRERAGAAERRRWRMKWQAGVTFFTQGYEQLAGEHAGAVRPVAAHRLPGVAVLARLEARRPRTGPVRPGDVDPARAARPHGRRALRLRGQGGAARHLLRAGHRAPAPRSTVSGATRTPRRSSRWVTASSPSVMVYGSISEGFKAGGWNPASPAGSEAYDEEHAWHIEGGVKGSLASGRMYASRRRFQHRLERPAVQRAEPAGARAVLHRQRRRRRQPRRRVRGGGAAALDDELFGNLGFTNARFGDGSGLERRGRLGQPRPQHAQPTPPPSAPTSRPR